MKKPLISIVTVVYNAEKHLEQTIQSVITQTYGNVEYIVIDGGSSDGTVDIIKKYENKIDYWVSEKDSGIYDAMNKGIKIATGDFINFLNAADTFFKDSTLERVVNSLENENRVYFGRAEVGNADGSWLYPNDKYNSENIELWLKKSLPNHQSMFFPKIFYKNIFYNLEYTIGSDSDYKFRAEKDCGFIFLDIVICKFKLGGISSDFNKWKNIKKIIYDSWRISMKHKGIFYTIERVIKIFLKYLLSKLINTTSFLKYIKG